MNNNNYTLGLDIGITSVGYGVIDINKGIFVDYGVRLFNEGTAENNEKRRGARGRRRLTRRRTNRLDDMKKVLETNDILSKEYIRPNANVYELRKKGLTEKLDNNELVAVILHITKHRGSCLDVVDESDSSDKDSLSTKAILAGNDKLLASGKYVCEVQLDRLLNEGKIRGHKNNFKTEDYIKEAEAILKHQDLSDETSEKILEIIQRKRAYYEGPGSEKSPTPYGPFFLDENGELKHEDLIGRMRGRCSVFPEEFRAPKMSLSAELFNFLNDINNLKVNGESIDFEDKEKIVELVSLKGNITPIALAKLLEVDIEQISGFRINKSKKPLLTEFKGYKILKKIFKNNDQIVDFKNINILDSIAEILSNYKGIEDRKNKLKELPYDLSDDVINELSIENQIKGYHALSFKALRTLNEELYKTDKNQMQLIYELNLYNKRKGSHKGQSQIQMNQEAILSPVAKRSINETLKVVNALRKRYGEFESIVVEMTRDKNSKEQKKRIEDSQKYFEQRNEKVDQILKDMGKDPTKVNGKTKAKIRLYEEQDGKSAYTFMNLDLERIINDPKYTEIDHIIPLSVSLDDSQNNKVLITRSENQMKGQRTPFMAFKEGKFNGFDCTYEDYKQRVLQAKNLTKRKKSNLLFEENITKYDVIHKFINRNLIDTSYACRTVLNTLSDYFKDNGINTKVHTINGKITHKFRVQIQMEKDRDADYLHHAIDALIVASVKKLGLLNGYLSKYTFDNFYDPLTGEIKEVPEDKAFLDPKYIAFIANLKNIYEDSVKYYKIGIDKDNLSFKPIKISWKVDTKPNRQISDETIYSARITEDGAKLVEKIPNIYDPDKKNKKIKNMINGIINDESTLLMKENDPQTFDILKEIVVNHFDTYKESKDYYKKDKKGKYELVGENPLAVYKEEHGPIQKYSKKGNGPVITTLKYYSENLGNHIDITKNYDTKKKKVILKQISPYRTDFYKCLDKKIRFVTVRYKDVRFEKSKGKYVIDENWYRDEMNKKKINSDAEFLCSMHRNELIGLIKKENEKYVYDDFGIETGENILFHDGVNPEIMLFTVTNNDKESKFEIKSIFTKTKKRLLPTSTTFEDITKYATDVLGNLYEVKENKLKLEFD